MLTTLIILATVCGAGLAGYLLNQTSRAEPVRIRIDDDRPRRRR